MVDVSECRSCGSFKGERHETWCDESGYDAMAFRIQSAVMHGLGLYWSPAGWMTRQEWEQFNSDDGIDQLVDQVGSGIEG